MLLSIGILQYIVMMQKQMTVQLWNVQQLISVQFLTLTPFPKSHLSQMSGQRIKSQLICPK